MRNVTRQWMSIGCIALLLVAITPQFVRADWDPAQPAKWVQLPDLTPLGMDVNATWSGQLPFMKVLADDFPCTSPGLITDVHIWGSWLNDQVDPGTVFKLSIHKDVPKGPNNLFSYPGPEVWQMKFTPSQYVVRPWATAQEDFFEPNTNQIIGRDTLVWQYNFFIPPALAFPQEGTLTNPVVYWLDVQAFSPDGKVFGWKTTAQGWNDDAVYHDTVDFGGAVIPTVGWRELIDPRITEPGTIRSLNMSFVITPEPASLLGLVAGTLLLGLRRRSR